ncbi:ATP-dependent helicase, partial [Mesorhizobium sp. M7A.F.Ca.CA.002.15.1.1]
NGRRDGRRPGGENKGNGFGKKRFGDKPAFAGERKPDGAKPAFKGNNKRRFGGKRPAARAA